MKEMTNVKGNNLLLVDGSVNLCGYKIRSETFKQICETMVGLKKVPRNLLFEKQQDAGDSGIRLYDSGITLWLPTSAILFSFSIKKELTPEPVMETLAKEMLDDMTEEQLEALGNVLTPHGEEVQEVKNSIAGQFASSKLFRQNPFAPFEGRDGKFWRVVERVNMTDQDILTMNFDIEPVPEPEETRLPPCDKRATYGECLALPGVDERLASKCANMLRDGKCPKRLDKSEREKFAEDFPEEARARTFDGGF